MTGTPTGPALARIEICSLACLVLKCISLTKHWRLRGSCALSVGFVHNTRIVNHTFKEEFLPIAAWRNDLVL